MSRGIIPFILALVGLSAISFASINPLFEWEINGVVKDPVENEVRISSSRWIAWFGDAVSDQRYISRHVVELENGKSCSFSEPGLVVNRSRNDELLERLFLTRAWTNESKYWVTVWLLIEIALSVAYSLWFIIWHEHRPVSHVIIFVVLLIAGYCLVLMPAVRVLAPNVGSFIGTNPCHGTVIINVKLLRAHYWVPILFCIGIFAELAALVMMVLKMIEIAGRSKESPTPTVGYR